MISFQRHPDIDAALFKFVGEFTMAEYSGAMKAFMDSDVFRPGMNTLWDLQELTVESVTTDVVKTVADYMEAFAPQHEGLTWKVALVVGADVVYGVSRMFTAYAESAPNQVMVFRSMDDAEAWLVSGQ